MSSRCADRLTAGSGTTVGRSAPPWNRRTVKINLLSNAIKYNRSGGQVWLAAQDLGAADGVILSGADTGQGIAPTQLAGLFQPFNRLGRESSGVPGSGLGLALSQALMLVMAGELRLAHSSPPGSRFELRLPRA